MIRKGKRLGIKINEEQERRMRPALATEKEVEGLEVT